MPSLPQKEHFKHLFASAALVAFALLLFFTIYEKFPRIGWVDPSIYTGYILNESLYKLYNVGAVIYQGSRLSYILPGQWLNYLSGPVLGRALYALTMYLGYLGAIMVLAHFLLRDFRQRIFATLFFLIYPLFIAAIFYGGSDGPASVYLLVSIACLVAALHTRHLLARDALAALSGFLAVLSICAHILMVLPILFLFPTLLIAFGHGKTLQRDGLVALVCFVLVLLLSHFIFLTLIVIFLSLCVFFLLGSRSFITFLAVGALTAVGAMTVKAAQTGLEFYLWSNIVWSNQSVHGSGAAFIPPFEHWIRQAIVWLPVLLLAGLSLTMRVPKAQRLKLMACRINLIAPLLFYIFYDRVLGGNLLGTPPYFNLVFPCFAIGFFLLLSLASQSTASPPLQRSIWLAAILALITGFIAPYTHALYKYHHVNSGAFYHSQSEFVKHIAADRLPDEPIKFIYFAAPKTAEDLRVYSDYFMKKPRYFDYLDSLVGTFLWSQSTLLRIDPDEPFKPAELQIEAGQPVILLTRNSEKLTKLRSLVQRRLGQYHLRASEPVCYDAEPDFTWCYQHFRWRK